ncbi:MAG: ATPase, partial [Muribaculaceae bacterium]|nr:ATPase [Muribaculaceae bacterium]
FVELLRRGYIPGKTLFYYRTRNDKEIDFVTRKGSRVEQLIQVCYDMSSEKTRKRELDALIEAAEELRGDDLLVVTNDQNECIDFNGKEIRMISIDKF